MTHHPDLREAATKALAEMKAMSALVWVRAISIPIADFDRAGADLAAALSEDRNQRNQQRFDAAKTSNRLSLPPEESPDTQKGES